MPISRRLLIAWRQKRGARREVASLRVDPGASLSSMAVVKTIGKRVVARVRRKALKLSTGSHAFDSRTRSQLLQNALSGSRAAHREGATDRCGATHHVISFDVFDTLITRRWLRPPDLFIEVGCRLIECGLFSGRAENWATIRVQIEAELRAAPAEEVSLDEIYQCLGERMSWSQEQLARAQELEICCELEAIRPIAVNVACYNRLLAAGVDVILVSDTYFDRRAITRLLRNCGIEVEPERLYISSEVRATKRSGRLFEYVAHCLRQSAAITHIGDNMESDVYAAAAAGVSPLYFANSRESRYEDAYYEMREYPLSMRSALAGAVRATRLRGEYDDEHLRTVWDTAVGVAAPMLFGFVLWTLCKARRIGISHLYFVARDGQILARIANTIVERMGWTIRCSYLYGSRQAWHLPGLLQFDDDSFDWILKDHCSASMRDHLAKVDLDPQSCCGILARYGFLPENWDQAIVDGRRDAVRRTFGDPELQAMILSRASECRDLAQGYLRAAGVLAEESVGIVDIGWHGTLQTSLSKLLRNAGHADSGKLTGFYLGLIKWPGPSAGEAYSFLHESKQQLPSRSVNGTLLEVFCAADHGSVRGYRRTAEDHVEPLLDGRANDLALQWGLRAQQEAVAAFSSELTNAIVSSGVDVKQWAELMGAASRKSLALFTRTPTTEEAEAFGKFRHAAHQTHARAVELAPRLSMSKRLCAAILPRTIQYDGFWLEGSMRRCGQTFLQSMPFSLFSLRRLISHRFVEIRKLARP
jgi:HAD superfamily hydrolase (TIGR01549 family)